MMWPDLIKDLSLPVYAVRGLITQTESMTDMSDDTDASPPRQPVSLREWVKEQAEQYDVDPDDLLIQSTRRDPMYKGTDADHAKAAWFAELWEQAVDGRDEDRIHVRGVHYFIVMNDMDVQPPTDCSWSIYQNTEKCYNYLESASVLARILGYIPLGGVFDNKHDQRTVTEYRDHRRAADATDVDTPIGVDLPPIPKPDDVADLEFDPDEESFPEYAADHLVDELADNIRFDEPTQAPFHIEVWCEKGLPDYIKGLCEEMGVNVVVEGEGDLSLTIAHEFVRRVESAGKPAIVCYLSDFDPKGTQMPHNVSGKIAWLEQRGDLTERVVVDRLAVTPEQIEALSLPRKPIEESSHTGTGAKAYDTLVDEWEQRRGVGACELNALEQHPDSYRRIVRDGLDPYVDDGLDEKNREAIDEWKAEVRDALVDAIEDAGLDDLEDLRDWMDQFNDRLDDAEDVLRDLRDLTRDGYFREWYTQTRDAVAAAEYPVVSVPAGEGRFPDDPLYDSSRDYVENVARLQRDKVGE
jgi:hypothetical protein